MSGITSGIGLASGIDTASLIDQLMAIEARPLENLQQRLQVIETQRTSFLAISAQLLALQNSILQFDERSFFRRFEATSSNDAVLTALAGENAAPGDYTLRVHSLVASHSVLSRGFADADTTPIGQGTLSIEIGNGRVNRSTELDALNGGNGVRRGTILVTDRSGATAEIELSRTQTIEDVLDAINMSSKINVRARVTGIPSGEATGDRIIIEDLTVEAEVTGNLIIADKAGGFTAADLGIVADVQAGRVDGRDLVRLSMSTPLALLNDGNGVGRLPMGAQVVDDNGTLDDTGDDITTKDDLIFVRNGDRSDYFSVSLSEVLRSTTDLRAVNSGHGVRLGVVRITDREGRSVDVDLADESNPVRTIRDVDERITQAAEAAGMSISLTMVNAGLVVTDGSEASGEDVGNFTIEDISGFAAADLGIANSVEGNGISGRDIYRISTIGDVINAINYAPDNNGSVRAGISADGNAITLKSLEGGTTFIVSAGAGATAAADLGILKAQFTEGLGEYETRHLIAGLDTVLLTSLNGGSGVDLGRISFTVHKITGETAEYTIDFSGDANPQTLQDVVDLIDANTPLAASINAAGTGIELRDQSGDTEVIVIEDVSGTMAADLGIAGVFEDEIIDGTNLQLQYISRQTLLSDLNYGAGVDRSHFNIIDSTGALHAVALASRNPKTIGDVIDAINSANPAGQERFEARINDTGDGIVIIDKMGGDLPLTIEDVDGGHSASDLKLAGVAREGEDFVDGSFEIQTDIGPADTLNHIVEKLKDAGLEASVLNDGGSVNPYSLTITSAQSGRRGAMVIDSRGLDLGLRTLSEAQDAIVTIGDADSPNPLFISSSTNTLEGVINGVTLNLASVADESVTISVTQDLSGITESIKTFVDKYNDVQAAIDDATSFNSETLERGPLLGDSTINLIRNRLHRVVLQRFGGGDDRVSRLTSIGLRAVSNNRLEFDADKFQETYESSPGLVEELFAAEETGLGAVLEEALDDLTRSFDGVLAGKDDVLTQQQELINDRIDRMNETLDVKRARLEAQFIALETAISAMQGQQTSLNTLAQLAGQTTA
ncbi:MAG: flagellar filament capping protein FliD [Phycisphaerales bacterium]|nr:MAG: flagellar filament capping protein FliD [Phycisphaerales bacterium]